VRQYLRDNALYWLENFRADGLRWDMTLYIRTVFGNEADVGQSLSDGYGVMQWINREINERSPWKISIAEDLQDNPWLTRRVDVGGAGFDSQWAANFVHPVRRALIAGRDEDRSMAEVRAAILGRYDDDAFKRVIYTESHDEVANGRARLPQDIAPQDPGGWFARKRSALGAVLVFTAPGIPMVFQGQEFLEDEWFRDADPLDWSKKQRFAGMFRLYQDLIRMRRDRARFAGLQGHNINVFHCNDADKVVAFHRWDRGGTMSWSWSIWPTARLNDTGSACRILAPGACGSTVTGPDTARTSAAMRAMTPLPSQADMTAWISVVRSESAPTQLWS
jgi:1,4-alpha-glucan branching enzyme